MRRTRTSTSTGTNFQAGATVAFSGTGITVNSVAFNSASSLTVNLSISGSATLGARNVTVTNPDAGTFTLNNGFTVNGAPVFTSLSPTSLPQGATNAIVMLNGSNFRDRTAGAEVFSGPASRSTGPGGWNHSARDDELERLDLGGDRAA